MLTLREINEKFRKQKVFFFQCVSVLLQIKTKVPLLYLLSLSISLK